MQQYATRDEFLAPAKRRYRDVHLPVQDRWVRIRSLHESESEAHQAKMFLASGRINVARVRDARRRLIALCLCDETGERLLSDADVPSLAQLDAADLQVLQDACMDHCGMREGDIEALAKNSAAGRDA